ncbi:MAG: T9SS type B sorting domain-containing protein [Bacteroidetes bacterium]|nr:T9SS type B sorting domain-containing protein [Bacteroidota bacterium]
MHTLTRNSAGFCCGLLAMIFSASVPLHAQQILNKQGNLLPGNKFSESPFTANFIDNKTQFDKYSSKGETVKYGAFAGGAITLFSGDAVQYVQDVAIHSKEDKEARKNKMEEKKFELRRLTMKWVNANSNIQFETGDALTEYFSCPDPADNQRTIYSSCFTTITAKNVYNGIDVVYTFPAEGGVKYALRVHPGADLSQVKIQWEGDKDIQLVDGNIEVITEKMGTSTDHAPKSFYEENNASLTSSFILNADKTIGFDLGSFDHTKTVLIDPWTFNPAFTTFNSAYDIAQDGNGNIYLYGGANPYELKKFTSAGAPVWTFATFASGYYGDMCLEPGTWNIYCAYGPWGDAIIKISPAAGIIYQVNSGNFSREIYRIYYNPVSLQMTVMGMNLPSSLNPMVLNINPATGAYSAAVQHPTCTSGEIRGMCVDANGDVYGEVFNTAGSPNPPADNLIWHVNSAYTTINSVQDGYLLNEIDPSQTDSWFSGYNGMAVGCDLYSTDGLVVKHWDKNTLALLGSVPVAGGIEYNTSGLCLDGCGNVYVGTPGGVKEYDAGLNLLTTIATSGPVYDVCLGANPGEILACGQGFFASLTFPVSNCSANTTTAMLPSAGCTCSGQASVAVQALCTAGNYTYQWLPTGGTNDTAFNLCPGTYTVLFTNTSTGGVDSAFVTVTGSVGSLAATTTSVNPTCFGSNNGSITANPTGGTGPYTYLWHPGNQITQTITGQTAGTYTVDITDATGCTLTQTITLVQPPGMTFTTANTATSCTACNGTATVNVSGGNPGYTYSWNSTPAQSTSTATNLCAGTYTCTIVDANGCQQDTSVIVPLTGGLTSTASIQAPITCFGSCNGSLTATPASGTAPYTYSWNTSPVQTTQTATGLCAGNYQVDITDANGCTSTSTITLTQPAVLNATPSAPLAVCAGKCGIISIAPSGGTPGYTYSWNPGAMTTSSINICPATTGFYTVTVTDANGCTTTDSIQAIVNPLPVVAYTADTTQGCSPVCVTFTNNTPNTQSLLWEYGNGNSDGAGFQCYTVGTYNVTLVITGTDGCIDSLTNIAYINSWLSPTAGFVPSATQNILMEANFCFNETALNATTYLWNFNDPNDANNSTVPDPCHSYTDTGTYCVQQIVYSSNGCTDTTVNCIEVVPDPASIYVPNTFTPNGNGLNEIFMPVGYNIDANRYHFMVFDRWGMLIYDTRVWGDGWDGTFKGNKCQIDTYVWKVECNDILGYHHSLIGHVNLIR